MTPERIEQIRSTIGTPPNSVYYSWDTLELIDALELERARLDCLAAMPPGARLDALADPRGLRAALDERIAGRAK